MTYRCYECGGDFYNEDTGDAVEGAAAGRIIDDEEALHEAEEEIRRETEADDDRRYRG